MVHETKLLIILAVYNTRSNCSGKCPEIDIYAATVIKAREFQRIEIFISGIPQP